MLLNAWQILTFMFYCLKTKFHFKTIINIKKGFLLCKYKLWNTRINSIVFPTLLFILFGPLSLFVCLESHVRFMNGLTNNTRESKREF
jgi:hypothetical protein